MEKENKFKASLKFEEEKKNNEIEKNREKILEISNSKPLYSDRELRKIYQNPNIKENQTLNPEYLNKQRLFEEQIESYVQQPENKSNKGKRIIRPQKHKKWKIAFAGILAAAIAGIAGNGIGTTNSKESITSSQAVYTLGETPDSLGINDKMFNRIQNMENTLKSEDLSNLDNSDLIKLAPELYSLSIEVIQNKLSHLLEVDADDIKPDIENGEEGTKRKSVNVYKKGIKQKYYNRELGRTRNTIPDEISELINKSYDLKNIMFDSNVNRDRILNLYNDTIDKIDRFVAMKLQKDEKGNIIVDRINTTDIEKIAEEKGFTQETKNQIQEKFKISDDDYSVKANDNIDGAENVKMEYDDDGR